MKQAKSILILVLIFVPMIFAGTARAAIGQGDVLIKGPGRGTAVYYLASDGKRYVFPNQRTYLSWFSGFGNVTEVTGGELASFPLGGNVTNRPGVRMVKIASDPKLYAVEKGGVLRWVTTENIARQLYGSDWNTKVDDVPDAFFANYRIGQPITELSDFDPEAAANSIRTIAADKELSASANPAVSDTHVEIGDAKTNCLQDRWICGSWGSCSSGKQTRSCALAYDCPGFMTSRPAEVQACASPDNQPPTPTPSPTSPPEDRAGAVDPVTSADHVRGPSDAFVTMIGWSDYACPFCQRFHETMKEVLSDVDLEGKVRWVFRHYPLSFHAEANPAALAAECAGEQGKFWEFTDEIFDNQSEMGAILFDRTAGGLGLNQSQFDACLSSRKLQSVIDADRESGDRAGITGTPYTIIIGINGSRQLVPGALPIEQVKLMIQNALIN